ncbi:class I tRNA ligase family protein, partial [Candidatus Bathyarchaeota archaeon]|nr:class I tRNA ligase family protein [Candidatus Bathyarchaeota archaeon]
FDYGWSELFNYIFYKEGDKQKISQKTGIPAETITKMQEEFQYWYPVDLRVSAKELVPNHLTFFIFHHAALFPPKQWPKGIGVNGMLMIEGKQMHKSKGNFVTMKNAVEQYGADATRCTLLMAAEGMDDPDWRTENVKEMQNKLESFYNFAKSIIENSEEGEYTHLERWLMSTLQRRISAVTENLEQMKTRTALSIALFEIWNDFRWYIHRKKKPNAKALKQALKTAIRLLAPFAPHTCEEIWNQTGEKNFISLADWPTTDPKQIDLQAEEQENLIKNIIEDTFSVLKATKITPKKICYYTASPWKWKIYINILEKSAQGKVKLSELMKEYATNAELKKHMKELAKFAPTIIKEIDRMQEERKTSLLKATSFDEKETLKSAKDFLAERFAAEIHVYSEEDVERYDPKMRASLSAPCRPAIYVE